MKEEKFLHLLRKKRGFFETILDLTEQEASLTIDEWISVLKQKKILLSCIEKIDQELAYCKGSLDILSQEISEEFDEMKKVMEQILHLQKGRRDTSQ